LKKKTWFLAAATAMVIVAVTEDFWRFQKHILRGVQIPIPHAKNQG
jgi:hypothetical protein